MNTWSNLCESQSNHWQFNLTTQKIQCCKYTDSKDSKNCLNNCIDLSPKSYLGPDNQTCLTCASDEILNVIESDPNTFASTKHACIKIEDCRMPNSLNDLCNDGGPGLISSYNSLGDNWEFKVCNLKTYDSHLKKFICEATTTDQTIESLNCVTTKPNFKKDLGLKECVSCPKGYFYNIETN